MSTNKQVKQMAHLKQQKISDSSCKAIIVDTIMDSVHGLTKAELSEEITTNFHVLISKERLDTVITALLAEKNVYVDGECCVKLLPNKFVEFNLARAQENALKQKAIQTWIACLKETREIPLLLENSLSKAMPFFLRTLFVRHGVSSYELLSGEKENTEFDLKQISKNISEQFAEEFRENIETLLPTIFYYLNHPEIIEYLEHSIDKAVGYISEVISEENLQHVTDDLHNLTLYLDTNILYRLLNLQGQSRYESIRETLDFCKKYGVKLKVSALTQRELTSRLKYDSKVLIQYPTSTNLARVGYRYRTSDNYVSTYWNQAMRTCISVDDFNQYYRNYDVLLESDGIEVEKIEISDDTFLEDVKSVYEKISLRDIEHEKSEFGIWHDAYNFAYVRRMQKVDAKTSINAGCLFLTTDQALISLQREEHEFQDEVSAVLTPSQLLQIFGFTQPKCGYEDTFVKFFAASSLGRTFKYDNSDIQEILSRINHYNGINPIVAEKILGRELVNTRYLQAETENEKEEIIYNSISEELLSELNLTKEQIASLKETTDTLKSEKIQVLEALKKNKEQYLMEKEDIQKENREVTKQLEQEKEARKNAERNQKVSEENSERQKNLYIDEKFKIWRKRKLFIFWISLIAIIIIPIISFLIVWKTKDSGHWGILSLLAIPLFTIPFGATAFIADKKIAARKRIEQQYTNKLNTSY